MKTDFIEEEVIVMIEEFYYKLKKLMYRLDYSINTEGDEKEKKFLQKRMRILKSIKSKLDIVKDDIIKRKGKFKDDKRNIE
jgi:hypothetical protein